MPDVVLRPDESPSSGPLVLTLYPEGIDTGGGNVITKSGGARATTQAGGVRTVLARKLGGAQTFATAGSTRAILDSKSGGARATLSAGGEATSTAGGGKSGGAL